MKDLACVGCQGIRDHGGGHWHNGEPHYVGCPTELSHLRRENLELREQVKHADGTWVRLRAKLASFQLRTEDHVLGLEIAVQEIQEYLRSPQTYHPKKELP